MNKVFVAMADFARVENGIDRKRREGRNRIVMEFERLGRSMLVKFRRVGVRFKKGNMENGMETREVGRESKLVGKRGNLLVDREWTESTMV